MNFKTTILLIALLAVAGVVLFFTKERPAGTAETNVTTPDAGKKLLDVSAADITKVVVTPANDKPIALERAGGMNWRLTQPIAAPADSSAAESLVSALADLASRSKIDAGPENAQVTGLNQPNFRVELTTKDGKTARLAVGNKSGTGGNAYVRLNDEKQADLVPAEFYDSLDKPASSFRSTQVVDVKTPEISEVQVHSAKGDLSLTKTSPEAWQINAGPTTMPADQTEVSDLLMAVTGLRATEYTPDDFSDATAAKYQLDNPATTVTLISNPVTTQPASTSQATTQRATTTIKFGRYDDIQKRNVFVTASNSPAIAKVPASTLTQLDKRPLDLRDRKVLTVNADQVESITIFTDKPSTTQPTTKPAEQKTVTIARRHDQPATRGVAATQTSTTQASTQFASTQGATTAPTTQPLASTQPVEPPTKWQIVTGPGLKIPADDFKVDDVLSLFSPLRAEKFLDSNPTTQSAEPHDRYTITLTTGGGSPATYQLNVIDRGTSQPAVADYNGLLFELPRTLIERVSEKFEKGATPSAPRREPPGGPPGLE